MAVEVSKVHPFGVVCEESKGSPPEPASPPVVKPIGIDMVKPIGIDKRKYTVDFAKLKKGIRTVWDAGFLLFLKPLGVPPQAAFYMSFAFSFSMGALNCMFVVYTVNQLPDKCEHSEFFCLCERTIAWTEMFVVCLHAFRVFVDLSLMLIAYALMWPHPDALEFVGFHMPIFSSNLKITSGFSVLAFMPVTPKLLYWFRHSTRLWFLHVANPPLLRKIPGLCGFSEYHKLYFSYWKNSILKGSTIFAFPLWLLAMFSWFFCVFTVQVLLPLGSMFLPLLAPMAFLVKMAALPDVHNLDNWSSTYWLNFLGVVNQTAKVWNIDDVEEIAVMTIMRKEMQTEDAHLVPYQLRQEFSVAAVAEIGVIRTCVLSLNLDAMVLADIWGHFLIFDPKGEAFV